MTTTPVPVLGTQGYVEDDAIAFTHLLMNFMTTDHNQSTVFSGELYSLSKEMQEAGNDVPRFMQNVRKSVSAYLGAYYDNVNVSIVEVPIQAGDPEGRVTVKMSINIISRSTGNSRNYDYLLKTAKGQFEELLRINNTGY